ncbi:hypothetical protein FNV43_RR05919 [Rhamnella rubrinervis]|uniref:Uncharacterized protein n=1 Tax=Rhamnella rubrinervis TaxID=2594499 RepID=A0A8K0MLG6_9ROSA|nr:hypothetical protein FNV43_RR05919 [Rhamnella rubrinervis]
MIVRQPGNISEDVVEFSFNGKEAIFIKREFGFITGLKMKNSPDGPPPHSNRIRNTYFGHLKKIKNSDEYHRTDTYDNVPMNDEGEKRDEETNVMQNDNEDQFITPSKVILWEPRIKKCAYKLKSPFVVSIETCKTLKSILPAPMDFNPKRPPSDDISMKFFEFLTSDMDEVIDYDICDVNKEFFRD